MRVRGYPAAALCWVDLFCPDPASVTDFYGELLGWTATGGPGAGRLDFRLGDLVAAGATASDGGPAAWVVFVSTDDIEATAAAVASAGGRVVSPPAEVGTRGRAAICADPQGAVFGLWQRTTFPGTQVHREPGAPSWGELWTRDTAGATAFYKEVFGWSVRAGELAASVDYGEFYTAGRTVGGLVAITDDMPAALPPRWGITVEVADCAAAARRCGELGGAVAFRPMFLGVGTAAFLVDPQGALFGVFEPIPELLDTTHAAL
ncbi:VOC family protein [Luedemannella helvata]|uniref:VOC family protein n=1 Tax=Luedemannella helvata TaxID=349315 RepID=A0ABP4WV04_9ACTN